jgi:hypothetical protein
VSENVRCPRCSRANPPENRFCGGCGASLQSSGELIPRREDGLTLAGRALHERLRPIGKVLAVGLATLAAEVGLSWLRHRTKAEERPSTLTNREPDTAVSERLLGQSLEGVLIEELDGEYLNSHFAWRAIRSIAITEPPDKRSYNEHTIPCSQNDTDMLLGNVCLVRP